VTAAGVSFRVWAPDRGSVAVVIDGSDHPLTAAPGGYFSGTVAGAGVGTRYTFRLDGGATFNDPASRYQPEGPHGPSEVADGSSFPWTDAGWPGRTLDGTVLYELHVGTFTREGTFAAAARELPELAACGVNCLEVMPVAEFPGRFGWGYDGTHLFAPYHGYGTPDDLRRLVDAAHANGLAVILDVVYNHLGPDGNYLGQYAKDYFTDKHKTEWGAAINFDGPTSGPVREFVLSNVAYWVRDFHLDGLRLDATQNIYDSAPPAEHILADIGRAARAAAGKRRVIVINENESQHSELCRPVEQGGYGLDALWNDDFHHSAMVALTGKNEAYYTDYLGDAQEFVSAVKYGYLYQGQHYSWQEKRRGRPGLDLPPAAYCTFIQNHDQVANSGRGLRAHHLTSPGRYRAMTALMLLAPGTPLLFQGQEFAADSPFFYFADHNPDLAKLVEAGRAEFLGQFRSLRDKAMRGVFAPPHAGDTFERSKLDFADRERNAPLYQLTKDLLKLRRDDPVLRVQKRRGVDGAVLGQHAFCLRWFADDGQDRLLVVNFGRDLHLQTCPEPLLAPPARCHWHVALHTDSPAYGGSGGQQPDTPHAGWRVCGEAAVLLAPEPIAPEYGERGRLIVY
jgi:maltooligosyltrehalose trehalohydrolase